MNRQTAYRIARATTAAAERWNKSAERQALLEAQLERARMDEVHESRANRRAPQEGTK